MELWSFLKIDSRDEKTSPGAESREEAHLAEQLESEPEQRGPAFCFCSCQLDREQWAQMTEYKRLAWGQPNQSFMFWAAATRVLLLDERSAGASVPPTGQKTQQVSQLGWKLAH